MTLEQEIFVSQLRISDNGGEYCRECDATAIEIPEKENQKTDTLNLKRPAVDIEFHDLVYAVEIANGEFEEFTSVSSRGFSR